MFYKNELSEAVSLLEDAAGHLERYPVQDRPLGLGLREFFPKGFSLAVAVVGVLVHVRYMGGAAAGSLGLAEEVVAHGRARFLTADEALESVDRAIGELARTRASLRRCWGPGFRKVVGKGYRGELLAEALASIAEGRWRAARLLALGHLSRIVSDYRWSEMDVDDAVRVVWHSYAAVPVGAGNLGGAMRPELLAAA